MALNSPSVVRVEKKPQSTFVGIMSEIRSWLDRRQIESVSFKPVADAEKGVGFEIAFNSEDEANLFSTNSPRYPVGSNMLEYAG